MTADFVLSKCLAVEEDWPETEREGKPWLSSSAADFVPEVEEPWEGFFSSSG